MVELRSVRIGSDADLAASVRFGSKADLSR
jgi:hypothetical protein